MSGILGMFQRDGTRVALDQLRAFAATPSSTVADSQSLWTSGPIGLSHAPLPGALPAEDNPVVAGLHLLYLAADARLDSRAQLCSQLKARGRHPSRVPGDNELILHSYALWGPDCVEHLRGDFAFAIWDARSHTLLCARDHFGIKPFYYAVFPELFLFSNNLAALRRHPRVSAALNDSAVADFLLFGLNCDNASTTFRDIQRLPPAHTLLVSADAVQLRRYWEVPVNGRIRYAQSNDYVENFLHLWNAAVSDRLDQNADGILLSGGLDSAAVAATAEAQSQNPAALRAFCIAHENLPGDPDPQFAAALAASLGIPFESFAIPSLRPFQYWDTLAPISPEPVDDPLFASLPLAFQKVAAHCRVLLSGEGSDNLLHFQMAPYAADLLRRREWPRSISELLQFAWRRPFPWRGLRSRAQSLFGRVSSASQRFPQWIAPDFAARLHLRERWNAGQPLPIPTHPHPTHPVAHASLYLPQWTRMFELENPSVTKCPVNVRYPFLDLRVVEYLLAIPPFPWSFQKTLLRQAMAGRVLDSVRLRPKAAFTAHPLLEHLRRAGPFETICASKGCYSGDFDSVSFAGGARPPDQRSAELSGQYINPSSLAPLHAKMTAVQVNQNARPFCFNFWLQSVR